MIGQRDQDVGAAVGHDADQQRAAFAPAFGDRSGNKRLRQRLEGTEAGQRKTDGQRVLDELVFTVQHPDDAVDLAHQYQHAERGSTVTKP